MKLDNSRKVLFQSGFSISIDLSRVVEAGGLRRNKSWFDKTGVSTYN